MLSGVEYIRDICKKKKIAISTIEKECGFANGYLNPKKVTKIPYDRAVLIADYLNADLNSILGVPKNEKDELNYDKLLKIYTRGKNNLTPEEKIKLAQIILSDRNDQ